MSEPERYQGRVISSERITPAESQDEVRELLLDLESPDFRAEAGQSIAVHAPMPPESEEAERVRYYSLAEVPYENDGKTRLRVCVRRCSPVNAQTGEEKPVSVSNYLCDLTPGDTVTVSGPFGLPFRVPDNHEANLVLIGTGTGIAPFRAFVKHLYQNVPDWKGRVWLFYGAHSGLELIYMNDEKDDFAQYMDKETFEAFKALSPKPNWSDPLTWDMAFAERGSELLQMMEDPKTYVYVAGMEAMAEGLDKVLAQLAGSAENWHQIKSNLKAEGRWAELLY